MGIAANSLSPQLMKTSGVRLQETSEMENFKYDHLELFLQAHLSVLTPPTLLQVAGMIMTALPCSFIVSTVTVTSSGKAAVKKKCNTEITC